jgi:hypothetical protein
MAGLIQDADAVISLHRSECFGLLLAEAMARSRPVIATGWSGNLEFMNADVSLLVPSRLVKVRDPQGVYHMGEWAEPDVDAAYSRVLPEPTLEGRARKSGAQTCRAVSRSSLSYSLSQSPTCAWYRQQELQEFSAASCSMISSSLNWCDHSAI